MKRQKFRDKIEVDVKCSCVCLLLGVVQSHIIHNKITLSWQVLTKLSCAARDKKIYLVVNLDELVHCDLGTSGCPSDSALFYNTNIVFNRKGTIVAK